jgi:hypothetical protein
MLKGSNPAKKKSVFGKLKSCRVDITTDKREAQKSVDVTYCFDCLFCEVNKFFHSRKKKLHAKNTFVIIFFFTTKKPDIVTFQRDKNKKFFGIESDLFYFFRFKSAVNFWNHQCSQLDEKLLFFFVFFCDKKSWHCHV